MNTYVTKVERALSASWVYTAGKMLLVIALSRTQVIGMNPFGIAYAAFFAEENALCAFFALLIGTAAGGGDVLIKYISAALIFAATVYIRRFKDFSVKAVALGVSLIVASAISLFKAGATPAKIILIVPEAFMAGGLYRLFSNEKGEGFLEYGKEIIIAGACLGGLYGLKVPYIDVDLAIMAGMIITMSAAFSCGIPVAVLTGTVLGFLIFIKSPSAVEMTGIFAISAASAAALGKTGKTGASAGFLSGMTVGVLCMGNLGALSVTDIFTAPVLFMLLPERIAVKMGRRINDIFCGQDYGKEGERIANQLKTVAQAVEDLGSGVKILSKNKKSTSDVYETVFERVCRGCRNQEACFGSGEDVVTKMEELKKVIDRDGFLNYANVSKGFKQSCLRSERFLNEFSHMYEMYKQNEVYNGEAVYDRNIAVNQYGEFSNIINGLSQTVTEIPKREEMREKYSVSIAVCQEPRGGQEINGDTVIHFKNGSKYFVILCDGMGSGNAAREISSLAARLFAEFFTSGIEKRSAVNMINSALALNADRESFSSADILEIDLVTGMAEFLKIGSAQSFIKKGQEIEEISSSALPIGILENIEVTPQRYMLSQTDMILMVSDGIGEASNGVMKNEWIKKLFRTKGLDDEELAKRFLESAKSRTVYSDDMTSVIVRLISAD
ncbi:MAG: SpoIIE family protein phosphatase [Firmicutes bacterium]|nr:SpoIIE family protein phosphatase [Bacillota bacterium]